MDDELEKLNTVVAVRCASDGSESSFPSLALIVSSCDAPTFQLVSNSGATYHWRQDLTRPATPRETAQYWQERAEVAEKAKDRAYELLEQSHERQQRLVDRLNSHTAFTGE